MNLPSVTLRLTLSLLLPIAALAGLVLNKEMQRSHGDTFSFPIRGFDPRDLLSGHYLRYTIDYGSPEPCTQNGPAVLCLSEHPPSFRAPEYGGSCSPRLNGECQSGRFIAGIERFYVPEQHARLLERKVLNQEGTLVVNITPEGRAGIRELLIEGRPWREALDAPSTD